MSDPVGMVDVHFELSGEHLPAAYHHALWSALCSRVPWLAEEPLAGMHLLRGSDGAREVLLSRRSRLVIRLPENRLQGLDALADCEFSVADAPIRIGRARQVPIEPYSTLHAHVAVGESADEAAFMVEMEAGMAALGLAGKLICGKKQTLQIEGDTVTGYSLVVFDLKPDAALRLQQLGLGRLRKYGCGLFVPYKEISGIEY